MGEVRTLLYLPLNREGFVGECGILRASGQRTQIPIRGDENFLDNRVNWRQFIGFLTLWLECQKGEL